MATDFFRTRRSLDAEARALRAYWLPAAGLLLVLWGAWMTRARVGVLESSAAARIEREAAPFSLRAPLSGRLARFDLRLHQHVDAGALLFELDSAVEQRRLAEAEARVEGLTQQRAALQRQLLALRQAEQAEVQVASAARAVSQQTAEQAAEVARLAAAEAARVRHLREAAPERELAKAQSEERQRQTGLQALQLDVRRARREERARARAGHLRASALATELARLQTECAAVQALVLTLRAEIERRRVRAPVAGQLASLRTLAVGAYLQAGEELGVLLPASALQVVARFAPAAALGRIQAGQRAWMRLDGFPFTQYGRLSLQVGQRADEADAEGVRVELRITAPAFPAPLSHGLPGHVDVEVESVPPAVLLLRSLGRLLAAPGQTRGSDTAGDGRHP